MKILIALNSGWNLLNFRSSLIKALVAQGHEVLLAAPADKHVISLEALGGRFIDLPMQAHGTNFWTDFLLMWRFLKLLLKERPDVMLTYTAKPNVYGGLAARLIGTPVLNNISGLGSVFINGGVLSILLSFLYYVALARTKKVFFQNPDDYLHFVKNRLVSPELCAVLPGSGVDLLRFQSAPLPYLEHKYKLCKPFVADQRFVFLLVGRLLKDKGIVEYAQAASLVKSRYPWVEFALLGFKDTQNPNSIPEELLALWQEKGWLTYWGSSEDVREQLTNADCVVLPSYREGTPRTLLEAAAMGRPLVATDVPGCREVVRNGINGLMCRPRDFLDLADKMENILQMPDKQLALMGHASRQLVEERFDEKIVIDAYLQELEKLN